MSTRAARPLRVALVAALAACGLAALPGTARAATPDWPLVHRGAATNVPGDVKVIQHLLNHRIAAGLVATGTFDASTEAQVREFQQRSGLTADGVVGPGTWTALVVETNPGDTGSAVSALQTALVKHGYAVAVDGTYGPGTRTAVAAFKTAYELTGGDTVGVTTWQWLTGLPGGPGGTGAYRFVLPPSTITDPGWLTKPHHDYPAADIPVGTGVESYAVTAGTVTWTSPGNACGDGLYIRGDDGVYYTYCHFSQRVAANGSRVAAGQLVGRVGSSGHSTGPHLHFAVGYPDYWTQRCPQNLLKALYDGTAVPDPRTLPTTGCVSSSVAGFGEPHTPHGGPVPAAPVR